MSKEHYSGDIRLGDGDEDGDQFEDSFGPDIDLPVGAVIGDRYEIVEYLGNGTSAVVYRCVDRLLGNLQVAVKIMPEDVVEDSVATTRLYRELLTNFDFDHENIARFYECIRGKGYIGLVLEYVEGGTVEDLFEDQYIFTPEEVRSLLIQICKALEVIHKAGIVHRDLKPENVLLTESGVVKITDFGLARGDQDDEEVGGVVKGAISLFSQDSTARKATATGGVAGSPLYLAPEYIAKGVVTAQSDIYAVGVIGYQLLSGQEPYPQEELVDLLKAKMKDAPIPILHHKPNVPEELAEIVEKAMSIKPENRYENAMIMRHALEQINLGSLSQAYSQVFIDQQLRHVQEVSRKSVAEMIVEVYAWPFKKIVDFFSYFGNFGFVCMGVSAIAIFVFLTVAMFGDVFGLDYMALYESTPDFLIPWIELLRSLGEGSAR